MKYLVALFLAISAFMTCPLSASEFDNYLNSQWTGNKENLYLNITLSEDMEFPRNYRTLKVNNGLGCEIICKPTEENSVFLTEGEKLNEIKLIVVLNNMESPKEVAYTMIVQSSYEKVNEEGILVSSTFYSKKTGVIANPAINLNQAPRFFIIEDNWHQGVISFKNSFPYSNLE